MDQHRERAPRGGRGRDSGSGNRSQSSNLFQGLRKTLPPKEIPEVQVPNWTVESVEAWASQLKTAIADGKSEDAIRKMLDQLLSNSLNAFWTAIQVATWSLDPVPEVDQTAKAPPSQVAETAADKAAKDIAKALPLLVMEVLSAPPANHHLHHSLHDDIKIYAFSKVLQKSNELFQEVSKLYRFKSDPGMFLGHIRRALAEYQYGSVARAVAQLELQDRFNITEILFPLVMQDKLNNVFGYLNLASTKAATDLVVFLDALLEEKFTVITDLVKRLEIPGVRKDHLSKKHIARSCFRLAKKYNVPQELWKAARYEKLQSVMMFLIMKRYADQGIPEEDWEDLLCSFVKGNKRLGRVAVIRMTFKDDLTVAASCANRWGIELRTLPPAVRDALRFGRRIAMDERRVEEKREEPKPKPTVFYAPKQLPMAPIMMVDSKSKFDYFISKIKKAKMVGMDSEWRPVFLDDKPNVALLQLATEERVYLLDLLALKRDALMVGTWTNMDKFLFANKDVLKIGFSLEDDWNVIEAIDHSLQGLQQRLVNALDLRILCQNVLKSHPEVFPFYDGNPPEKKGLSNYVQLCFGDPLNKHQQFSNWEKRPLRDAQIKYAALDAFCLLDIYMTLKSGCLEAKLDFDALCVNEAKSKMPEEDTVEKTAIEVTDED